MFMVTKLDSRKVLLRRIRHNFKRQHGFSTGSPSFGFVIGGTELYLRVKSKYADLTNINKDHLLYHSCHLCVSLRSLRAIGSDLGKL